jgi:putative transcriptional regulator
MTSRLRELRAERGLTAQGLAERTGVTSRVIHNSERTGARPQPHNALSIARYFGLRVIDVWPETLRQK